MSPRLLSTNDLASYLSVSTATVRRMSDRGELPRPVRLPGVTRVFWDRQAVDSFVDRLSGATGYDDPDEALSAGGRHA